MNCHPTCLSWQTRVPTPTASTDNSLASLIYYQNHSKFQMHLFFSFLLRCYWYASSFYCFLFEFCICENIFTPCAVHQVNGASQLNSRKVYIYASNLTSYSQIVSLLCSSREDGIECKLEEKARAVSKISTITLFTWALIEWAFKPFIYLPLSWIAYSWIEFWSYRSKFQRRSKTPCQLSWN